MELLKKIERQIRQSVRRNQQKHQLRKLIQLGGAPIFAIRITGGLGDLIVAARFFRDFLASSGGGTFDVYFASQELGELIFKSVPGFRCAFDETIFHDARRHYLYAFRLNQFFYSELSPSPIKRVLNDSAPHGAIMKLLKSVEKNTDPIRTLADCHPRLDGALGAFAFYKGRSRRDFLHYLAGVPYGGDRLEIDCAADVLEKFGLVAGQYLTVHNGYDDAHGGIKKRATKVYADWDRVILALRRLGLNLPIIQIGSPTTSETISNANRNLVGQTKLKDAMALVAGSAFHLDNEGGFVHVAAAFGRRSCVVFGPTSVDFFAYPGNVNIRPRECGGCWWVESTWMINCPRGLDSPVCMDSHDPEAIAAEIMVALAELQVAKGPAALVHATASSRLS